MSSQTSSVAAGLTAQFAATGMLSDGSSKSLSGLAWSTSDATLATVDNNGLLTTLKQGTVTVSAASEAVKGSSTPFAIGPSFATGLSLSGKTTVVLGTPATLLAILSFSDKTTRDISGSATWSNSNPYIATIDASGNINALHTGYTKLSVTNGTFSAAADLAVIKIPRVLHISSDASRILSKAYIDEATGRLRMAGYVSTNANGWAVFPCESTDPEGRFLYVASAVNNGVLSGEVQVYDVDPVTGTPTPLAGSPFATQNALGCIEFERTGNFGFASNGVNNSTQLLSFSRNTATGALTELTTTTLPGVPTQVALDPLGKFLYIGVLTNNFSSGAALGFTINPTSGVLTPIPGTPFTLPNFLGDFSFHPSGDFVYMANAGANSIDVYSVNRTTGQLTVAGSIGTCINPTALRFSPQGKFAYTACSMDAGHNPNSASVESFAVAANGTLTHVGSTPSTSLSGLTPDSAGQFFYQTAANHVIAFAIGTDGVAKFDRKFGARTNLAQTLVVTGGSAPVKYTPKSAYITSSSDNTLSTYSMRADGTLGVPVTVPTQVGPFAMALWPLGSDLLVASAASKPNLAAYPLSASTGTPGAGSGFGVAANAGGVATDASGLWAFETDSTGGKVTAYGKFNSSWLWMGFEVGGGNMITDFAAGAGAGPVVTDPSGRFVFVANEGANSISAYQYFSSPELMESKGNYVLPFTDGSPFAIGAKPLALALHPNQPFLYVLCNDQTLRVFAIDYYSGGHLAQVASVTLTGQATAIATNASGQFIYAAGANGISAFSVSQTGTLTSVPLTLGIALSNVTAVYVEPAGKYLYLTASTPAPGAVFAFTINADGTLTAVSSNPVATPHQPSSMVFSQDIQ